MPTEADTCRTLILPKLYAAGWTDDHLAGQRTFTDVRFVVHRQRWADTEQRTKIIQQLADRGIPFQYLALPAGKPDADPFGLMCHLAFKAPSLTRRQRADLTKEERAEFFPQFGPATRSVLVDLFENCGKGGEFEFPLSEALKFPPVVDLGSVGETISQFGNAEIPCRAVIDLQQLVNAA